MKNLKNMYFKLKNLKNIINFNSKYRIFESTGYELINGNKKYSAKHSGKRCFILGNGPSLNKQDLKSLENEYVFTVNQISRHKDFDKIKTNYHFWADPIFFDISVDKPEDLELLESFKKIKTEDNNPECFFPIEAKKFVETFNLHKHLQVNYFKSNLIIHDNYSQEISFDSVIPGFSTVVQWAVSMAIYMGFKEIYLLGCDTTTIVTKINMALESGDSQYAYDITENEKKRLAKTVNKYSMEIQFRTEANVLAGYRILNEIANKKNINIYNCSKTTLIDSIPKKNYEDLFKGL